MARHLLEAARFLPVAKFDLDVDAFGAPAQLVFRPFERADQPSRVCCNGGGNKAAAHELRA